MDLLQDAYRFNPSMCSDVIVTSKKIWYDRFAMDYPDMPQSDILSLFMDKVHLYHWENNRHLNGVCREIYRRRKGDCGRFNCVYMRLDPVDIDLIENIILTDKIKGYADSGYFFDNTLAYTEDDRQDDLSFIAKARQAIKDGDVIYYHSYW